MSFHNLEPSRNGFRSWNQARPTSCHLSLEATCENCLIHTRGRTPEYLITPKWHEAPLIPPPPPSIYPLPISPITFMLHKYYFSYHLLMLCWFFMTGNNVSIFVSNSTSHSCLLCVSHIPLHLIILHEGNSVETRNRNLITPPPHSVLDTLHLFLVGHLQYSHQLLASQVFLHLPASMTILYVWIASEKIPPPPTSSTLLLLVSLLLTSLYPGSSSTVHSTITSIVQSL